MVGKHWVARWTSLAYLFHGLLRIISSAMFMLSGTSKIFAFPRGMPPDGRTAEIMTQAWIGGMLEVFGGMLLLMGLFTRPVAFILAGEMAVAYFQFHLPRGIWPTVNGGVSAVLYCFIFLYFSAAGGGMWSADNLRGNRLRSGETSLE